MFHNTDSHPTQASYPTARRLKDPFSKEMLELVQSHKDLAEYLTPEAIHDSIALHAKDEMHATHIPSPEEIDHILHPESADLSSVDVNVLQNPTAQEHDVARALLLEQVRSMHESPQQISSSDKIKRMFLSYGFNEPKMEEILQIKSAPHNDQAPEQSFTEMLKASWKSRGIPLPPHMAEREINHEATRGIAPATRTRASTEAMKEALTLAENGASQEEIYGKVNIAAYTLVTNHIGIPPQKLPQSEAIAKAERMSKEKESRDSIYFATGRSYSWLQKKKLGMVSRKKASKENVQKALQMYAEGQDISAIIQTTQVATSTIKRRGNYPKPQAQDFADEG